MADPARAFSRHDVRRGMDVYARDGGWLGVVLAVRSTPDDGRLERVLVGRWFGLLGRRWVAAGAIVNVSLERVVIE